MTLHRFAYRAQLPIRATHVREDGQGMSCLNKALRKMHVPRSRDDRGVPLSTSCSSISPAVRKNVFSPYRP